MNLVSVLESGASDSKIYSSEYSFEVERKGGRYPERFTKKNVQIFVQRLNHDEVKGDRSSSATLIVTRWIGVDLNTTEHVAVAADILNGKTMKPGKISTIIIVNLRKLHEIMESGKTMETEKKSNRVNEKRSNLH